MPRLWISLAFGALLALAWTQFSSLDPKQESGTLPITPATPYIRYMPEAQPRARILVVHGLNSNKEFMQIFCKAFADAGFEVYSIDLPGHGDSRSGFEASLAQAAVRNALEHIGGNPIVIGHSLGAGLLLDITAERHFDTLVLLSPAPTPVDTLDAGRVLVVTGRWDIPRINAFIPTLQDIGGSRLEWWQSPWGAHSSAVMNPETIRAIVAWLGGNTANLRTTARLGWLGAMFAAGLGLGLTLLRGNPIEPKPARMPLLLVYHVAAGGAGVLLLQWIGPLSWIRVFAMDYLVSFVLAAGLVVLLLGMLGKRDRTESFRPSMAVLKAVAAAAYVIVVLGLIGGSHVFHLGISGGRWWRFPLIAAASFPLFMADELFVRPAASWWRRAAIGILTKTLLGAFVLSGVLLLSPDYAFLALVLHVVVSFWIALWFVTEAVHRNTQDPLATAIFASLVQGWAFAAAFVIT